MRGILPRGEHYGPGVEKSVDEVYAENSMIYLTEYELDELEKAANEADLKVLCKVCAELRIMRAEYMRQSYALGKLRALAGHQPHVEYVTQLSDQTGDFHATPKP